MKKRAVDITYKLLRKAHQLEAKISGKNKALHLSVAEALRQSLEAYKTGQDRYDFHHLSLGALCMLFRGALFRFGRWQTLDSLVNYDYGTTFTKGEKYFVYLKGGHGTYLLVQGEGKRDGSLFEVSRIFDPYNPDGDIASRLIRCHPSDNLFSNRAGDFARECLVPFANTPLLDAIEDRDDDLLREAIIPVSRYVRGADLAQFYA